MQVPLEISFGDIPPSQWVEDYIRERTERLNRQADGIISCRAAVEREQHPHHTGNPFRVRVEVTLPRKKTLVGDKTGVVEDPQVQLRPIIRRAFEAVERQIHREVERRRGHVKHHAEPRALVVRLFPEQGYGFLKAEDGEEYYFHRNAVLHGDFDRLKVGTEVRFAGEQGEDGPQASTVQVASKPGARAASVEDETIEPPEGWTRG